jgi:release factor glutamine methyltransferase
MTVSELLKWGAVKLGSSGVDKPVLEAELLLAETLKIPRLELLLKKKSRVAARREKVFREYIRQRSKRIPAGYILKNAFFFGLEFHIEKGVLIPRPETELLVEEIIKAVSGKKNLNILDIGTGSGAIAVTLAKNIPGSRVTAVDISSLALKVARVNARKLKVAKRIKFIKSSLFAGLKESFDVIVSNPPYVKAGDFKTLQPEVKYEPRAALYGGKDGLDAYRKMIPLSGEHLVPAGILALEIGYRQAGRIRALLAREKIFRQVDIIEDYSGIERIVIART